MCAGHIYATWKKSFSKSEYKNLFWGVAYNYHEGEYKEKMKAVETYDIAAYQAFIKQEPEKWCRAFFDPKSHCAEVHNNLTEAFNRTIKIARAKPVITMLEDIRRQAMRRISRRLIKANKVDSFLTPITMAILEQARKAKKYCKTIRSSTSLYEHTNVRVENGISQEYHADMPFVCLMTLGKNIEKYVAEYYEASALKNTYDQNIKHVNGEKMWISTGKPPISIPDIRKPRGRPKTRNRRKEPFEYLQNPGKSTRHGRVFRCSNCGQEGHIKSGCKNEQLVVEGLNRRRGRPCKLPGEIQSMLPPKVNTKKRKNQPTRDSQPSLTGGTLGGSSSQAMQPSTAKYPVSSSAPQPSVSSNKPHVRKRGRPLKAKPMENVPRNVGMFTSPFTG